MHTPTFRGLVAAQIFPLTIAVLLALLLTGCGTEPVAPTPPPPSATARACAAAAAAPVTVIRDDANVRVVEYRWCVGAEIPQLARLEFKKSAFPTEAAFDAFRAAYLTCATANAGTDVCVRQFGAVAGVTFLVVPTV